MFIFEEQGPSGNKTKPLQLLTKNTIKFRVFVELKKKYCSSEVNENDHERIHK